jgi:predicted branched-subunit amino acid permease
MVASVIGVIGGQAIPNPVTLGLDVVFPAAMAGLGVALVRGRAELVAAVVGAAVAVTVGLASDPAVGIVLGGLLGPVAGMVIGPIRPDDAAIGIDPEGAPAPADGIVP